jgi:cytochrome d ubiquinol oxidase subunit I
VLRTAKAVSPVGAGEVSVSLLAFLVVYAIIFSVGVLYILRLVAQGPTPAPTLDTEPAQRGRPPGYALAAAPRQPEEPDP